MCMELGMHLCFSVAKGSSTFRGQAGYILVLLTHGRSSECLVLRLCGQPREVPVSLLLVVHPLIRQTFKAVFVSLSWRCWRALRPANSLGLAILAKVASSPDWVWALASED